MPGPKYKPQVPASTHQMPSDRWVVMLRSPISMGRNHLSKRIIPRHLPPGEFQECSVSQFRLKKSGRFQCSPKKSPQKHWAPVFSRRHGVLMALQSSVHGTGRAGTGEGGGVIGRPIMAGCGSICVDGTRICTSIGQCAQFAMRSFQLPWIDVGDALTMFGRRSAGRQQRRRPKKPPSSEMRPKRPRGGPKRSGIVMCDCVPPQILLSKNLLSFDTLRCLVFIKGFR